MSDTSQNSGAMISIDGVSLPVELQVDVTHMTLDDAIASGLFDVPDEPGMVQIPVTLDVTIPNALLWPPAPPSARALMSNADGVPPPSGRSRSRRRFGNYPKAIAAQRIAESFRDMFEMRRGGPGAAFDIFPAVSAARPKLGSAASTGYRALDCALFPEGGARGDDQRRRLLADLPLATTIDASLPPLPRIVISTSAQALAEGRNDTAGGAPVQLAVPSGPGARTGLPRTVAAQGAIAGGIAGMIVGGIGGGAAGTVIAPGVGTATVGAIGAAEGAAAGAVAGAAAGAAAGVVLEGSAEVGGALWHAMTGEGEGSPSLKGDPYHPESVEGRIKPPYKTKRLSRNACGMIA